MNTLFKLFFIPLLLLVLNTELFAVQLSNDTFNSGNVNGWAGDSATYNNDGWLYFTPDGTGTKTYHFGIANQNKTVKITYRAWVSNDWESSGSYKDYFNVLINDTVAQTVINGGGVFIKTINATLDATGSIKVSFNPNTTASNEYSAIDYIKIETVVLDPKTICPGETIVNLDGTTGSAIDDDSGTISGDTTYYYHFTPAVDGELQVSSYVSATYNSLYIKNGCGADLWSKTNNSKYKDSPDISVTAGQTIVIALERRYNTSKSFSIEFNFSIPLPPSGDRPFTLFRQDNIVGDIQLIGNSVKLDSVGGGQCAPNGTNNNAITATYADRDSDASTYNSTSANLVLPANVTKEKVLYATLYWQGRVNNSSTIGQGTHVKIKTYGQASYQVVDSNMSRFNHVGRDYQGSADVTQIIKDSIEARASATGYNEPIWIADVYAPDNSNGFGVWSLAVVYKDSTSVLKNISTYDGYKHVYNDTITANLQNFLTPKHGVVNSNFYVFAGEGDITLADSVTLTDKNNNPISLGSNIFKSSVDIDNNNITNRNPSCQNTIGADIRGFSIGTNGNIPIIGNGQTSTKIKLRSDGDEYVPGFFAFSTQLYEPRVCYYIDTIVDENNHNVFENAAFSSEVISGKKYQFNIWISNMKKNVSDTDLEDASLVQVYMQTTDFDYTANSSSINNIGASLATMSDPVDGDLGEFNGLSKHTWRVGQGATSQEGGLLQVSNSFADNSKKAFISFNGKLNIPANADTINLLDYLDFKASFQTDSITIGASNAQQIVQCQNLDVSGGVGAPVGAYNAVEPSFTGNVDPIDPTNSKNAITTKIVDKPFTLSILSLDNAKTHLQNSNEVVNISIIPTPSWTNNPVTDALLCTNAGGTVPVPVDFAGSKRKNVDLNSTIAMKSATIKIKLSDGTAVCSRDIFAIRPNRFALVPPAGEDIELLRAGLAYNFSLYALTFPTPTTTTANGYTVTGAQSLFANLDANKTLFAPDGSVPGLNGTLQFSGPNFNIVNGNAPSVLGLSFDDVGIVNIQLVDTNWSSVDIANGDTPADCTPNGAYICGNINATFIPDHFTLSNVRLENSSASSYTYLSNDLNESAGFDVTITAMNGATIPVATSNFDKNSWENPVNVTFTLPPNVADTSVVSAKSEITTTQNLSFAAGAKTINYSDTNSSANLIFNYNRTRTTPINPFRLNGAAVTLVASSLYTSTSGASSTIGGTSAATQNATFVYGRTHAPRQRFVGHSGNALIYYEIYCSGTINGNTCDKTLLPNGVNSRIIDDPRWYVNQAHAITTGTAGVVTQKGAAHVTSAALAGVSTATAALTYDVSKGYPYKATMENNASTWLLYNPYKPAAPTNEFEVEFINVNNNWAGKHETDTSTKNSASNQTNRRTMW